MNRIDYINKRLAIKYFSESDYTIINPLIHSLLPIEACDFLDLTFKQDYRVRRYVLKKISNDIFKTYSKEHKKLITLLIKKMDEKGFGRKESCSSAINFLYSSLPIKEKGRILNIFSASKSSTNRNRAFKIINSSWNKKYQAIIEQAWLTFKDQYCLKIILIHFPSSYLIQNYKNILQYADPYQTSKLFLKLGEINFEIVGELKKIDQISYSYVLTKFDKRLSDYEAMEILKNNYKDDRIGLLLWCFGQMGLWDIIIEYDNNYSGKNNCTKL